MQRVKTQLIKSKISYTRCRTLPQSVAALPHSVRRGGRTSRGETNTNLQYELKKNINKTQS